MDKNKLQDYIRIFLIIAPIYWSFHLVLEHNAQIDAVFMLIFSFIIYKYSPNE
tara:strand:+ start:2888 stop:3046 length:159 start_codon:yes stop_codon:yes gene_type:complete